MVDRFLRKSNYFISDYVNISLRAVFKIISIYKNMRGRVCKLLHDYLDSLSLMSLATTDGFNLWCVDVFYLCDECLNIYFIGGKHTRYVNNILKNMKVSLSIIDYNHVSLDERVSVQARGICENLGGSGTEKILERWNKKFAEAQLTLADLERNNSSLFKIVLTKVKYMNTSLNEKVLEFDF